MLSWWNSTNGNSTFDIPTGLVDVTFGTGGGGVGWPIAKLDLSQQLDLKT
jgi:hypothetical protein